MARKQSSTIYYQGNKHKEIYYQGHYHDKMYKGSQLVWEKLAEEGKYKWIPYIYSYAIHNNETYMYAIVQQIDLVKQVTISRKPHLCKWNRKKGKIEVIKTLDSRKRSYILTSTPYYLALYIKENDTIGNAYIIDYDFTNETEETKIVKNTLDHPINISNGTNIYAYTKDGIVTGYHTTSDDNELLQVIRETQYGESIADKSVICSVKTNGTRAESICFKKEYIVVASTKSSRMPIIIKTDSTFSTAEGVGLVDEEKQLNHYLNSKYAILIHNNLLYILGGRTIDSSQCELEIFCYDGSNFRVTKRLRKAKATEYLREIVYIDGFFIVFESNANFFYIGKTIEKLEKKEYAGTGDVSYLGCPVTDEDYIYISVMEYESRGVWSYSKKFLKISKETLEIIETVTIEAYSLNE